MVSQRLHSGHALLAALFVDGRQCAATPVRGTGVGKVAGLCVRGTSAQSVRAALDWMPGRILVLADAGLSPDCLTSVARSAHLDTLAAIVVLATEGTDLGPLGRVESAVPVVLVPRESDQQWVRRAVRLMVEVRAGEPTVDLRSDHPPRPRRGGSASIILGSPGTVRH
ncbi:MAG TPA: hypothetical protein VES03_01790 [Motilibacterales bacterium]|nr:hypothetical protein [Motilibacterales bacterium]